MKLFTGYSYSQEMRWKKIREQLLFEWKIGVLGENVNDVKKEAY
jgi:hypothetical protein